jgi:signal transduction histidine kinase
MILGRLGIRGKLNLLLLLALVAILLVATPFVVGQVDNARSAGQTAEAARQARELGALAWELQRESVLTAGYLASPSADNVDLVRQQRIVDDTVNSVRSSLGPAAPDELTAALVRIGSLQELRQNALRRGVSLDSVARTYHAVFEAVIDALRLVPQKTSDAEGTRQLTALDALLRANEENALRGVDLIVAAVNPQTGTVLLDDASAQAKSFIERFVQQANVEHAALVVQVEQGQEARRVDTLAGRLPVARTGSAVQTFVAEALADVATQLNLRRPVQDQVTSQIADAAAGRAADARRVAWTVGLGAALLFALVAILAVAISRSIANPLRRLTTAATTVADLADTELVRVTDTEVPNEQVSRLAAIDVSSSDELGKLAAAFNRVQSTAAMLVERQAVTRHNVSLMFANVAQRTQNLVRRQLALVDELERNEQDERLLASLYRLDHLSTRLRRNADNLLVVSGTRDETNIAGPIELATSLRSALAEIEEYQRVRLGDVSEIMLASSLGSDLVQIFAELLENAASFSPPESFVDVSTTFLADGSCLVGIVDHGIGMTAERLAEENQRLVERERLDIAPTSVLGLFVVGRLARRHTLTVELVATHGGGITARVTIPAAQFTRIGVPEEVFEPAAQLGPPPTQQALMAPMTPVMKIPSAQYTEGFVWFPQTNPADAAELGPSDLRRRVPGAQLASAAAQPKVSPPVDRPWHDPVAIGDAMDSYQEAIATAAEQPAVPTPSQAAATVPSDAAAPSRSGLRRRVAGAQLPGAAAVPPTPSPPALAPRRDPVATGAAMDGYQSAIATAAEQPAGSQAAHADDARRGALSRRVPGASLAPGILREASALREQSRGARPGRATAGWRARDPDTERAAFDAFATGLARAVPPADTVVPGDPAASRDADPTKESKR